MQPLRSKAIFWGVGAGLLLALAAYWLVQHPRRVVDRVYRIGWQNVPPFQQKAADGSPAGLAVDLVRDAARRRGIRLKWEWYPGNSETALRDRHVDLWPLITITPDRTRVMHISKPYLQHDFSLLVLAGSRYYQIQDVASGSISYRGLPIGTKRLHQVLPNARLVPMDSYKDAVENVCSGRTDAAFLDEFTAGSVVLSGVSCSSQSLRAIAMPMLRSQLGVGSTSEASTVADEIRRGIDSSALEGGIIRILTSGGYFSQPNIQYFTELLNAQRRERWLIAAVSTFACLLALTVFAADRIRRQRNRIKATEAALRQSEQKLRLMADNLIEMVMMYDMDRRLVFANSAVEEITGYSLTELQHDKSISWIHPDDRSRMLGYRDNLFHGVAYRDQEYRLVTKDGRIKWAISTWGPVHDEAGRQVGVQGSERDITKRKFAEQALRESERRFRELLEGVQLAAVMIDACGTITFCNDYTLALTGWSREEVIGRPAKEFFDWDSRLQLTTEMAVPLPARLMEPFEGSVLMKDGDRRWIQWSVTPLCDSDGRAAGFASLGEDVTELRNLRAESARRETEQQFRNVADTAPLMIWVTGLDKGCTFVNKGWLSFTGRTLEQELGNGWAAGIHPDDLDYCFSAYAAADSERRIFQVEHRLQRADGEYRWMLCSGVPRFGPDGEFAGYIGTNNDITDLKRSRDEDVARQKLETVGKLASGIAHDFNNLLGGVLAQADLALARLASGGFADEQLHAIRGIAIRGAGIVRQLMIYARQESEGFEAVDLSRMIEEMVELLQVMISKHALLKTDLGTSLPPVRANPAQLWQLIINLVTNASEAIADNDGIIVIRTALTTADPNSQLRYPAEWVELEISDSGCGISREDQLRIFDPSFTRKSSGHGLGLGVVQRVVQELGGTIHFESEPGCGTTFRILLPSGSGTALSAPPTGVADGTVTMKRDGTVLLVEDEASLRLPVANILRRKGLQVLEAPDGTEALTLIRRHKDSVTVVLLDITLPGATSREVLEEVRRVRPEVKVIVTSAYGPNKADASFTGMTIDSFLRKPYRLADLVSQVVRFLPASDERANPTVS